MAQARAHVKAQMKEPTAQPTSQHAAQEITKEMTIGEVVQKYPSVVEVLLDEGIHCVGCGASYYETIEEGLAGHGRTSEEIRHIVEKLNKAIPEVIDGGEITITKKAAEKLKEILMQHKKECHGLRVRVTPGGCSGYQYEFAIQKNATSDDKVIEVSGVKFFIDKNSLALLNGANIDYLDSLTGAGFKISNPNVHHTCGCGQSFN